MPIDGDMLFYLLFHNKLINLFSMLITELIDKFVDDLRSHKGYSEHTIRNYQIDLKQFLDFLTGKERSEGKASSVPKLSSIDFRVIREYLGHLHGGYKKTTIARKLSTIRSFFYFIEKRGFDLPVYRISKRPSKTVQQMMTRICFMGGKKFVFPMELFFQEVSLL